MIPASLAILSNPELLEALAKLVARDRHVEAEVLAHLGEVDSRRLYAAEGFPSMFKYCTDVLHFSEAAAFQRIRAARLGRAYPVVMERIRRGEIHLAGVTLLAPHLTSENHVELLDGARYKSKRQIEVFLADRAPRPEVRSTVRKLPEARTAGVASSPHRAMPIVSPRPPRPRCPAPEPLGEKRFKIQFTAGGALCEKLREVQALLRHQIPDGELAAIFDRALTLLREETRRKKFAETSKPRVPSTETVRKKGASRHIPAEIRRAVAARDSGQCAFVSESGRRCRSANLLEYHHVEPWARSRCHSTSGIELRCHEHNQYAAERDFGVAHVARFRKQTSEPLFNSPRQESGRASPGPTSSP